MINRRPNRVKFILALLVFMYCNYAIAAKECFFTNLGNYAMPALNLGTLTPLPAGQSGWLVKDMEFNKGTSAYTKCNVGPDGYDLEGWSNQTAASTTPNTYGSQSYNIALFSTNITGIYYAVSIFASGAANGGYIPDSKQIRLYPAANLDALDGRYHNFFLSIYQGANFVPSGTTLKPKTTGIVGHFVYGDNSDDDNIAITINANSFSGKLVTPSCTASLGSQNASGNTVNLGNYTVTQLNSGLTNPIPFTLNFSGCVNVNEADVTFTSGHYDSSTGYLKNNGTDMGVGVKITTTKGSQLLPDSSIAAHYIYGASSSTATLNAQLVKSGGNIQVGNFSAQAIFQIDYR